MIGAFFQRFSVAMLFTALLGAGGLAACQGCHAPPANSDGHGTEPADAKPTIRLYTLSTVAGALEPCGCTKNQLGGIDHLAAYIDQQQPNAPGSLVVGAGPLLFMDTALKPDEATQATWKAEAIATAAKGLRLAAWAPGANDWAAGSEELQKLVTTSGAKLAAENLGATAPGGGSSVVREVNGIKVGIVGVADPKDRSGKYVDAVQASSALEAMKKGVADLKKQGAQVLVGLASIPRGEALRVADAIPELNVLVIGKPVEIGDANDSPRAPELAGSTLVVEASNHLQTVGVVDLFVRGDKKGAITFADASGLAKSGDLLSLDNRIHELEHRIDSWDKDKTVKPEDLAARKADLAKLREEKAKLETPVAPPPGSFFRYSLVEVRDGLGKDKTVAADMSAYYKRVNEHNKVAFADRKPPAPEKGEAYYVGIDACTSCHDDAKNFWDKTAHAHAYPTLVDQFKEYNLDCVSCHVTGYGKAGGSTVTFNEKLQNVQCETCHGPGSKHAKTQKKEDVLIAKPKPETCVSECHHPPHVEGFDAKEKMKLIVGPGHGEKK